MLAGKGFTSEVISRSTKQQVCKQLLHNEGQNPDNDTTQQTIPNIGGIILARRKKNTPCNINTQTYTQGTFKYFKVGCVTFLSHLIAFTVPALT